jgi:5-formyltetrahydrofolate cyclo-ligase
MDKEQIRKQVKAARAAISLEEKLAASDQITNACLTLPEVCCANIICLYKSLKDEVRTDRLYQTLRLQQKILVFPEDIQENESGISKFDVECFIVPGIAFDRNGYRLGFGGGYFDRLLAEIQTPKIGLAFHKQILPLLPHESYDIVMDIIVTEKEIRRIGGL